MSGQAAVDTDFWDRLDQLVASSKLIIDRPKGSAHPRYPSAIYPVDYGYLEGTAAADGNGLDVWVGTDRARRIGSVLCIVDLTKRDAEVKILLGCTEEDLAAILAFTNAGPMRGLLVRR